MIIDADTNEKLVALFENINNYASQKDAQNIIMYIQSWCINIGVNDIVDQVLRALVKCASKYPTLQAVETYYSN